MIVQDLGTFKLKDKTTANSSSGVLVDLDKAKYPVERLKEIFIHKIKKENNKIRILAYWREK